MKSPGRDLWRKNLTIGNRPAGHRSTPQRQYAQTPPQVSALLAKRRHAIEDHQARINQEDYWGE